MFISAMEIEDIVRKVFNDESGGQAKVRKLDEEIKRLKEEKADLEFRKSLEEKEIKHLVKMKEEKILIETDKERLSLAQKFNEKEMQLQRDYHNQMIQNIEVEHKKMEHIYEKILERLPNVNMEIKRGGK